MYNLKAFSNLDHIYFELYKIFPIESRLEKKDSLSLFFVVGAHTLNFDSKTIRKLFKFETEKEEIRTL